jgi:hypothetical protein
MVAITEQDNEVTVITGPDNATIREADLDYLNSSLLRIF